jgi:ABC-type transport system involved in multi-copper enzyme maturation permease subunit
MAAATPTDDSLTKHQDAAAAAVRATSGGRLNFAHVLLFEWIKLRSLRSNWITLASASVVISAFGVLAAVVAAGRAASQGGSARLLGAPNPLDTVLTGSYFALLIIGVLGALLGAREYSSGMIRLTLTAVPGRLNVLWARVLVFAAVVASAVVLGVLVAFVAGMQVLSSGGGPTAAWSDPGVARALLGTVGYLIGIGLLGLSLGVLLRSIAASIGVLVGGVLVIPAILGALLPESWKDALKYLPSNAGNSFTTLTPPPGNLGIAAGAAVFTLWVIAAVFAAAVSLRTRDA